MFIALQGPPAVLPTGQFRRADGKGSAIIKVRPTTPANRAQLHRFVHRIVLLFHGASRGATTMIRSGSCHRARMAVLVARQVA